MNSRLDQLESTIASLGEQLAALDKRLSTLERGASSARMAAPIGPHESTPIPIAFSDTAVSSVATHLGRILLIFGGAYLLRALTDLEVLPAGTGVPIGAAYALLWMGMAFRTSRRTQQRWTAAFYGIASTLLALPLLYEAATRFALLSGTQAAVVLTAFFVLTMSVSYVTQLRSLAWILTFGSLITAMALLRATETALPYVLFLLFLAMATLWIFYARGWRGLHWLGAIAANASIAVLALLSTSEQWAVNANVVQALAVGLMLLYLLSFALRTHVGHRTVGWFEIVQSILAIGVAYGAAIAMAITSQTQLKSLGALSVILGVSAFALASTPRTRTEHGRNFFYYSTVGLALVVGGSALLLSPAAAAVVWSVMAVALVWSSRRYGQLSLSVQATLLVIAAGISSGLLSMGIEALSGDGLQHWPSPELLHLIVATATVVCLFVPVAHDSDRWGRFAELPQLVVLALSVWEVGGLLVAYLAPVVANVPGPEADVGLLAALRTAVLALAAVTLSLSSRHARWPEARWLAYPLLALVGLKLLAEDFPHGRPLTLFVSLAIVGGALIAVARLLRGKHGPTESVDADSAPGRTMDQPTNPTVPAQHAS